MASLDSSILSSSTDINWSEEIAKEIAIREGITLNNEHLDVIHASRRTCTPIRGAVLLWVTPNKTLVWGQGTADRPSGVYSIIGRQAQLLQRLDRLDQIIQTAFGPMLQGANNDDQEGVNRFILPHGQGYILTQSNASISLHRDGRIPNSP